MPTSPRFLGFCLGLLILLFGLRCWRTHRVFNDTADEAVHISAGLEMWRTGRYALEPQHPPLARLALALPAYLAGLRQRPGVPLWTGSDTEFYWRTLGLARLGNLIFAPFLLVYVYLWGSRLSGPQAGLAAAALVSFSPNLLAHAALATLDFAAAATMLICAYHLWRWTDQPGTGNCLAAALAFGFAALTKFSALVFLPLTAAFFLLTRRRRGPAIPAGAWKTAARQIGLFALLVSVLIWGGYWFETGPLPPAQFSAPPGGPSSELQQAIRNLLGQRSLPAPAFLAGVLDVIGHNSQGHACYLLGRVGQFGWWYYFPVALALKSTIPFLLLLILAAGFLAASPGRSETRQALAPLGAALVILLVSISSNLNLGVRHILAIYPFLALTAAVLFCRRGRRISLSRQALVTAAAVLVLWHAAESVAAHPDYLAYFNQIARGREEEFLLDSNLDWGQDLERLRLYLEQNKITAVSLSYFGRADPARLGIAGVRSLAADSPPAGWVAVSKAHIAGLALAGKDLSWLRARHPVARIGKSILVYYFPGREGIGLLEHPQDQQRETHQAN